MPNNPVELTAHIRLCGVKFGHKRTIDTKKIGVFSKNGIEATDIATKSETMDTEEVIGLKQACATFLSRHACVSR